VSMWESLSNRLRYRPAARRREWIKTLQSAKDELGELVTGTESEFLEMGGRLHDFYRRADDIAKMSSLIAAKMAGQEIESVTEKLREILDRVKFLEGGSRASSTNLKALLEKFEEIKTPLLGFERVVKNLSILCNFIRIENARFGARDTGFNTVADAVRKLGTSVESKSSQLLEKSEVLTSLIRENLGRISDFEVRRKGSAGFFLENAVQSVTAIAEKNRLSAASLQDVAARWEKISKDIGGVVTSVQFHDITRQRIEHARDAIEAASGNLPAARNDWGGIGTAADTCELQVAQLRHASDELVAAVEKIIRNLGDIGRNATEIAVESQAVAGIASGDGGEKSFLHELEKELSALIEAFSEYIAMNRESMTALGLITDTVGDMSVFVKEIDTIGIEMKMIALNACVHAAHIGEEGMALGVLANSIQQLSDETSQRITAVEENLRAIITAAGDLSAGSDDKDSWQGRRVEVLRALMQPLQELDGDIVSLAARIDHAGAALTEDIEKTISGITVHERIAGVIGEVSCAMEDVTAGLRASIPTKEHAAGRGQHLEKLAAMYTMQQERDIHSSVTVFQPAVSSGLVVLNGGHEEKADDAEGHKTGEEMGDNVELF